MKKILIVLLALMMIFTFSACGGGDEDKTISDSNTPDTGTTQTGNEKTPEEIAAEFASGFGTYNGQPILWKVLDIDRVNEKALLISSDCIAEVLFHETEPTEELTWETSDLRKWLGGEFYDTAFTGEQKDKILEVINPADTNSESGTQGGSDTPDKVFILSASEMVKYFADDADMAGTFNGESISYWTRTPGDNTQGYVCTYGDSGGGLYMTGNWATSTEVAVRPAIWVSLSDEVKAADSSGTDDQGNADAAASQQGSNETAAPREIRDFQIGIEGVPAEWQKGIGQELFGMEVSSDGSDFTTGYLEKFGSVTGDDYVTYKAYFDALVFESEADGIYNCDWGQFQLSRNDEYDEITVTWYVK